MELEKKPIIASVVRVIDEFSILIDAGYTNGVSVGMTFVIFTEGEEIVGLQGEELGKIEYPKAYVRITHVQKRLSTAQSPIKVSVYDPAQKIAVALSKFTYTERKELPVDKDSIHRLEPIDLKVRVGDKVRQIFESPQTTS